MGMMVAVFAVLRPPTPGHPSQSFGAKGAIPSVDCPGIGTMGLVPDLYASASSGPARTRWY